MALPDSTPSSVSPSSSSGKALARDSRSATSFFDGRLRFCAFGLAFSILETKDECLIVRLSFFVVLNISSFSVFVGRVRGFVIEPDFALPVGVLDVGRFPWIGACRHVS